MDARRVGLAAHRLAAAMSPVTQADARAVAHLMATIRPDWDRAGCEAAIRRVCDRELVDVALAALRFTARLDQRTPAALAQPGKHWADDSRPLSAEEAKAAAALPPRAAESCPIHLQRLPCPGCRADTLADTTTSRPNPSRDSDAYVAGVAACRQALRKDLQS